MICTYRFYYEASIRRLGKHAPTRLLYESREPVSVPESTKAELAFRISTRKADGRKTVTEILRFEQKLWWPMELPHLPGQAVTAAVLRAVLMDPNVHLLGLFPGDSCSYAHVALERDLQIREILDNTRESVLHAAKRKLHENILLCEGIAYSRGGEPLYIDDQYRAPHLIDPGANRGVDLLEDGLFYLSERLMRDDIQSIFRSGKMMSARQITAAADRAGRHRIEIIRGTSASGGVFDVRVDACFRSLWQKLPAGKVAFMEHAEGRTDIRTSMKIDLQKLLDSVITSSAKSNPGGNKATTSARAIDLKRFVRLVEDARFDFGCPELGEEARQTVAAAIAAGYDLNEKLDEIDDAFVWSLPVQ